MKKPNDHAEPTGRTLKKENKKVQRRRVVTFKYSYNVITR